MKDINSVIDRMKMDHFIEVNSKENILETTDASEKAKHSYFRNAFVTNAMMGFILGIFIVALSTTSDTGRTPTQGLPRNSLIIINFIYMGIQIFLVHNLIRTPRYWNYFRAILAIMIPICFVLSELGLISATKSSFEVSDVQVIRNLAIYLIISAFLAWQIIRGNIKSILSEKYHYKISKNIIEDKLGVILVWLLILIIAGFILYWYIEPLVNLNDTDPSHNFWGIPPELLAVGFGLVSLIPFAFFEANAYIMARFIDKHSESVRQHYEISKERWYGEN